MKKKRERGDERASMRRERGRARRRKMRLSLHYPKVAREAINYTSKAAYNTSSTCFHRRYVKPKPQ